MKVFLRGCLIAGMILAGVVGVMTVDIRTGHMAGYSPAIDMILTPVPVDTVGDSYAKRYEFTVRINNEMLLQVINN